ncbi:unnamed protein product [Dovyalis caffra]|uniref:Uncharacterized protein n=1 Tax=Dovyalis caffra TaxID=77055 RepID=A0AAV1QM62_9ROSI|nr:unnamed protein product [Dovyalis caffra]
MEEKRVFKGRKRSLSNGAARESSKGTSNSRTAMIESDRTELLRNCPEGLTGWNEDWVGFLGCKKQPHLVHVKLNKEAILLDSMN